MAEVLNDLISVLDAAKILDRAPSSVVAAADSGRLPVALRLPSGQRLFRRAVVVRYRDKRDEERGRKESRRER
jgi:hypothetical protein